MKVLPTQILFRRQYLMFFLISLEIVIGSLHNQSDIDFII